MIKWVSFTGAFILNEDTSNSHLAIHTNTHTTPTHLHTHTHLHTYTHAYT
eukprot:m.68487 g.68487  ORF g.68487 m.68487 type:complete len:50 (+) comp19896_c0_seq1:56-205(+)